MNADADTLERVHEMDRIAAALDAATQGSGRSVVIEGPPGIGKTRLVQDARTLAKLRGFERLQATGDELESSVAWSVVRQLVERWMSRFGLDVRQRILAGPSGPAFAALGLAPSEAPAGDPALARTLHALWWATADLAALRPLLITVDDAQWADHASLRFLLYLSRRIGDLPIALVVATRPPNERSGPLVELSGGRGGERLLPRPLSAGAVATLSLRRGVPAAGEVVTAVHTASGGNPFFAGQLLDDIQARGMALDDAGTASAVGGLGPSAISRTLLAGLAPDARALANAAAVLGARSDVWLADALVNLPSDRAAVAIDSLVTGNVLAAGEAQLVFVHPVIREAVLSQLGPGERASLHARAARALHAAGAPTGLVAAHLAASPIATFPEAAQVLRAAAADLLADGDAVTAASHLARAVEETPHDQGLRAALGFALLRAGEPLRAREQLRSAAAESANLRDRADRLAGAAAATAVLDGPEACIAELRAVLDAWPGSDDDPPRLVLEARLATACSMLPRESQRSGERLLRFADLPGQTPEERTLLALLTQYKRYDVRPAQEIAALAGRTLGSGALLEDVARSGDGLVGWHLAVLALSAADAVGPAKAEIARARTRVRKHGSPLDFALVSVVAGWLGWRIGDMAATEAESDAALAALAAEDPGVDGDLTAAYAMATHIRTYAALEAGDLTTADNVLRTFDERCGKGPRVIPVVRMGEVRALFALASDEPSRARELALELGDEIRMTRIDTPTVPWRSAAALAALRLGEEDQARSLAAKNLELARRWGTSSAFGAALRILAHVEPGRRLDLLSEAIAVLEDSPARLELARALVDLGEALRVAGHRKAASDPLRRGAALAAACGSRVLRQRALDGLASRGDQPRPLTFSGQDSLTASERRIAQLAIAGRTNRDIAQELFVTPKTVENHLGRVYVKLGVTGRRQLSGALS